MLAVWPLATFCFLRSFETRAAVWSIATGVFCALAMLGKYYSIFLIAGFAFAAIVHPRRLVYLFPIARFDAVNLVVAVCIFCIGAFIAAPLHALYRNKHEFKEGCNYFHQAAEILTKSSKEAYGTPLPRVSGDDGLAFAAAFYSPDHPLYSRPFQLQGQWGMPRNITLDKGWSALCFADDQVCMKWMDAVGNRTERETRLEFVINTSLWGVPGVSRKISAMMVPPVPIAPLQKIKDDAIEDFSARRKFRGPPERPAGYENQFVPGNVVHSVQTP